MTILKAKKTVTVVRQMLNHLPPALPLPLLPRMPGPVVVIFRYDIGGENRSRLQAPRLLLLHEFRNQSSAGVAVDNT